jgi:hypothetical protein
LQGWSYQQADAHPPQIEVARVQPEYRTRDRDSLLACLPYQGGQGWHQAVTRGKEIVPDARDGLAKDPRLAAGGAAVECVQQRGKIPPFTASAGIQAADRIINLINVK